jgi:hypothetical protein
MSTWVTLGLGIMLGVLSGHHTEKKMRDWRVRAIGWIWVGVGLSAILGSEVSLVVAFLAAVSCLAVATVGTGT